MNNGQKNFNAVNLNALMRIENRMCDIVCNGLVAPKEDSDSLYALRRVTGLQYDALNNRFTAWEDTDNE